MFISSLIDKLKPKHIVILAFVLLSIYLGVNLTPISWANHELFNSLFSITLTFSCGLFIFILYRLARQKKQVISKTLIWLSTSFLSWFIADVLWLWLIAFQNNPFPSPADLFYFAMYPTLIIAIFTIPSTLIPSRGAKRIFIEISILILTAILFFLFLIIIPGQSVNDFDNFSLFVLYLYPVLDVVIIWIILILFFSNHLKSSKKIMKYFILGIVSFTISDLLYFINSLFNVDDQGYFIDLGYYFFYFIIVLASFKGYKEVKLKSVPIEKSTVINQTGKWTSFIPGVFLISVVGFILIFVFDLFSISNPSAVILVSLIFVLFIIHQYLVVSENIRLGHEMSRINIELERKVLQRTAELNLTNKELQFEVSYRKKTEEILKQSEEKYRLIAENTGDVIWVINTDLLKFTYISPSIINLLGYSAIEGLNKKFTDLLIPEMVPFVLDKFGKRIEKLYAGDKSAIVSIDELQQICKDGSIIWVETATTLVVNNDGKVTDIIGVSRDIELRKKTETQIQQKNIKLEELNATKDKFFSIIAHDLKSPFNAIVGFSDLLYLRIDAYPKEKIKTFAKAINDSAKQTFKLLENLLEWSQLQKGKIKLNLKYYNLKSVVDEIILLHNEMAMKKMIAIRVNLALNIFVHCDLEITKTVLRNLVSNAIKFTNNEGSITIDVKKIDSFIEVQISDTGVGIPTEKIPFLFTIEQDISTSGTANEKGTGLGLLLCKELIEKQGGEIWVESTVGKGSAFYFTIPYIETYNQIALE